MKMMTRRDAVKRGVVNEVPEPFKRESMKLVDGVTGKGEKFKTFETTTAPRMFQLNVEKAVSELNIPREEAIRISQLPSDQQKLALQKYLDKDFSQRITLGDYNPKTFDAAKGGLAKILEL
jgi:ribosomal protein S10